MLWNPCSSPDKIMATSRAASPREPIFIGLKHNCTLDAVQEQFFHSRETKLQLFKSSNAFLNSPETLILAINVHRPETQQKHLYEVATKFIQEEVREEVRYRLRGDTSEKKQELKSSEQL